MSDVKTQENRLFPAISVGGVSVQIDPFGRGGDVVATANGRAVYAPHHLASAVHVRFFVYATSADEGAGDACGVVCVTHGPFGQRGEVAALLCGMPAVRDALRAVERAARLSD